MVDTILSPQASAGRWTESELISHVLSLDPGPKREIALTLLSKSLAKRALLRLQMMAEPMTEDENESITCSCIDCLSIPVKLGRLNKEDTHEDN